MKTLLFIVNVDWAFLSHRLPIALEALNQGYDVHVATGITDKSDELRSHGLIVHPLAIGRGNTGLTAELRMIWGVIKVLARVRPQVVHLVTLKPVLFGGIISRLMKVPAVVAAIPGLGFVFMAKGLKANVIRFVVTKLYVIALGKRNLKVIFQNPCDRETIKSIVNLPLSKETMIPGSGVNLSAYLATELPQGRPIVIMASRLLYDKGVSEFVEAARLLIARGVDARFWVVGEPDTGNPTCVKGADLMAWRNEGVVELLGYRDDIASLFALSSIVVMPSYREGFPKVLIEAAACARAVVTTDVPGCRDAIEPDKSGLLVPVKDSKALADAIYRLISDRVLCESMGQAGRVMAESEFAIEKIVETHLNIYKELESRI